MNNLSAHNRVTIAGYVRQIVLLHGVVNRFTLIRPGDKYDAYYGIRMGSPYNVNVDEISDGDYVYVTGWISTWKKRGGSFQVPMINASEILIMKVAMGNGDDTVIPVMSPTEANIVMLSGTINKIDDKTVPPKWINLKRYSKKGMATSFYTVDMSEVKDPNYATQLIEGDIVQIAGHLGNWRVERSGFQSMVIMASNVVTMQMAEGMKYEY